MTRWRVKRMANMVNCDIAVIGAGLAGLVAARDLVQRGADVQVFEAADRIGGRIHSLYDASGAQLGDLGPTWIWPDYQPGTRDLVAELGIGLFPQFDTGAAMVEIVPGHPPARQDLPGQMGISRITGGPQALIDALAADVPDIHLNWRVDRIRRDGAGFELGSGGRRVRAKTLVLAAPLRRLARGVDWGDVLSDDLRAIMRSAPTWMAAQAKATIVYDRPFWRDAGLSGRIASRIGPLVEAHDHSGPDGTPAALFGFVGLPPDMRDGETLKAQILDQLVRCFGPEAASYQQFKVMDWAANPDISTPGDIHDPGGHPTVLPRPIREVHDGLIFCPAETGTGHPGLIDGAIEAGHRAAAQACPDQTENF